MKDPVIVAIVVGVHLAVLLTVSITTAVRQQREDTTIFKIVDATELAPPELPAPPPPPPVQPPPPPPEATTIQDAIAEEVIETDEPPAELPPPPPTTGPPQYVAQHLISVAPGIPLDQVRSRIEYPPLANRQGIEGVVYLELFIDAEGTIQRIEILRDPGFGLGQAAVRAFEGVRATPAYANGVPVAVRYRYPIRFQLR